MSVQSNKNLIHRLVDALNSGDLDAVDGIFAPGYVQHDPSGLLHEVGIEEYKKTFSAIRGAFPDVEWTIKELLEDGDRVIGRFTFQGTHEGLFFNIRPTGRKITYPIMAVYRIEEGRIAEDWHIFHALGLWQSLIPEIKELIDDARG